MTPRTGRRTPTRCADARDCRRFLISAMLRMLLAVKMDRRLTSVAKGCLIGVRGRGTATSDAGGLSASARTNREAAARRPYVVVMQGDPDDR